MIRRNLVCRFVLSATLVPIAVSGNPEENEPVIMSGTAAWVQPQHIRRARRGTQRCTSAKPSGKYHSKPEHL